MGRKGGANVMLYFEEYEDNAFSNKGSVYFYQTCSQIPFINTKRDGDLMIKVGT